MAAAAYRLIATMRHIASSAAVCQRRPGSGEDCTKVYHQVSLENPS